MIPARVNWLVKSLPLLLITLSLSGCLSPEEKQERRYDALDISGDYTAKKTEAEGIEASFKIIPVEGRHRVNIEMVRSSELTAKERALIEQHSLDSERLSKVLVGQKIKFASTPNGLIDFMSDDVGDNYSADNGKTSKFGLCSSVIDSKRIPGQNQLKNIYYCIDGSAEKAPVLAIKGQVQLVIETVTDGTDSEGKRVISYEFDHAATPFVTEGKGFHTQYMGRWSGEIVTKNDVYLSNLAGLEFAQNGDKYYVYPLFRVMKSDGVVYDRRDTIEFNDQPYTFTIVETSTGELDTEPYPVVRLVYKNEGNGDRIIFVGTVWSQSSFAGNILLVTNDTEEELGAFRLARQ